MRLYTLGKFQIEDGKKVLDGGSMNSTMLTKLLAFLVLNRRKEVMGSETIIEALWQEEETENPAGALKNLAYRLRTLLRRTLGEQDYIITKKRSYCWNPQLDITVDAEEFEVLYEKAKSRDNTMEEAEQYYQKAIELYQGEFLMDLTDMHWVLTLNMYYHSIYLSGVKGLAELYEAQENYDQLEVLCKNALNMDKTDEELYYYLIIARMRNNKVQLALESYENACKILNQELGIQKPKRLQEIYEELLKMKKDSRPVNLELVQTDIGEESAQGTFFCGYPVFREIYRLEARKQRRSDTEQYLLLISIQQVEEGQHMNRLEEYRLKQSVNRLERILSGALRIGDVASQYSDSQYIVLLASCDEPGAKQVARRIMERFENAYPKYRNIQLEMKLEKLAEVSVLIKEEDS